MRVIPLIAIALVVTAPANAEELPTSQAEEIADRAFAAWNVPGAAVVVVKDGKPIFAKGYGVLRVGRPQRVDADTSFYIASATKTFTATALQMLVEQKRVDLDTLAETHLEEFKQSAPGARTREITVRDMAAHRTGLPRADMLTFGGIPDSEILRRIGKLAPTDRVRERFTYQNQMYLGLGEIVGRASGSNWSDVIQSRLLEPLAMSGSDAGGQGNPKSRVNAAAPHGIISGEVVAVDYIRRRPSGAGGINSTANDLAKWLLFHLGDGSAGGKPLLKAESLKALRQGNVVIPRFPLAPNAKFVSYGLGWFVHDYQGQLVAQHGGNGEGWTSLVWIMPDRKFGVAVLTNMASTLLPWALAYQLTDAETGTAGSDWITMIRKLDTDRAGTPGPDKPAKIATALDSAWLGR